MRMTSWYRLDIDEVFSELGSSPEGLSSDSIPGLRQKYGRNLLEQVKRKTKFQILVSQFTDVMILILLAAAVVSFIIGDPTDAFVILAIVIANAVIGFLQEYNAEKSVAMLQKMAASYAMVKRDGKSVKIDASELVPGDIIALNAGDVVPADARLTRISSLKTEEAALTGESHSIEKITDPIRQEELMAGDQLNMVFKGTVVSNGSATAVVTATGMQTELGHIAGMLDKTEQKTPLQKRLAKFSRQLSVIVVLICLAVFGLGLLRGEPVLVMFLTALSLAVAALPEALPAVITIALAKGAKRMVRQQALVRKLPAVETLGSVTYICSDKTGTLTQNQMTVQKTEVKEGLDELLLTGMIRNNEIRFTEDGKMHGDSTEIAMVRYAEEKGWNWHQAKKDLPLEAMIPFDSDRMRMSSLHPHEKGILMITKGAPGKMADAVKPDQRNQTEEWLSLNKQWASEGLRVLMFGYRYLDRLPEKPGPELEKELDLLGMVAMIDPPREEVIEAIKECRTAGIKTLMITGDQPLTAAAIAEKLEMTDREPRAMTGAELSALGEEELKEQISDITVFARVSPAQKLDIVKTLQARGEFVAMTGDGVNDAPSLKQADIGIAMGITGTDVSKEASDMILLDDNFATIVRAVKTGRRIYDNIRKFILYVLACNLAEILTIFLAPFFGLPIPLLPIHILWINLVTDGLPGLALSNEPAEKDIMKRPPRSPRESFFSRGMTGKILLHGSLMAAAALLLQHWAISRGLDTGHQQTLVFTFLCFTQIAHVMSVRFNHRSILQKSIFRNRQLWLAVALTAILQLLLLYVPSLHPVFKTAALSWAEMGMIAMMTLICLAGFELSKRLYRDKK